MNSDSRTLRHSTGCSIAAGCRVESAMPASACLNSITSVPSSRAGGSASTSATASSNASPCWQMVFCATPPTTNYAVAPRPLAPAILGTAVPEEIVIIGAHYDSQMGTPGQTTTAVAWRQCWTWHAGLPSEDRANPSLGGLCQRRTAVFPDRGDGFLGLREKVPQRNEKITAMLTLETIGYYSDSPDSQKFPPPLNLLYPSTGNFIGFVGNTAPPTSCRRVVGGIS